MRWANRGAALPGEDGGLALMKVAGMGPACGECMTNSHKNKRNSYLRVRDAFQDSANVALINGINALKKAVATYLGKVEELDTLARRESEPLVGIAQDKGSLKRAMCEDALPLTGALRALAVELSDGELRGLADVTLSDLVARRDRDCADCCESITEKAEANQEKLVADYGISDDQLDKFAALVEAFDAAIGKPKSAISRRKKIAESIKVAIKEIDDFLGETLDGLMTTFRERQTDTPVKKARRALFDSYTEARRIDDSAASRTVAAVEPAKAEPALAKVGAS